MKKERFVYEDYDGKDFVAVNPSNITKFKFVEGYTRIWFVGNNDCAEPNLTISWEAKRAFEELTDEFKRISKKNKNINQ